MRRRKAYARKRTATDVLETHLYQWAIDQLHMGCRLYSAQLLDEATLIANDLRVQHEVMIESGEREVGTRLKLPKLEGNAGSVWSSRLLDKKQLSWRMTNLQFKIDKATSDQRVKRFLERLLHIRWLHYYLHGEKQTLSFSNSDEKPMMMIQAAAKKSIANKGKRMKH